MLLYKLIPVFIIKIVFVLNIIIEKKNLGISLKHPVFTILVSKILLFFVYNYFFNYSFDIYSYFEHAQLIRNGQVPLVDFLSPYSLGFEYLMALPLLILQYPFMIAILFLLIESCAYVFLTKIGVSSKHLLLIAFNPVIFHFTVIDTQDEILMFVFVVLAVYCLKKQMSAYKTILISYGALFLTKILTILAIFPLYLKEKRNGVYLAALCILTYAGLYFAGFNIFSLEFSRSNTNDKITEIVTSGNIIWLLEKFSWIPARFSSIYTKIAKLIAPGSLAIINLLILYFYKSTDKIKGYLVVVTINFLTLLITYKMSFSYYYMVPIASLFLLAIHLKQDIKFSFFLFSFIVAINQSLFFIVNSENLGVVLNYAYFALQLGLVAYVAHLIYSLMKTLRM